MKNPILHICLLTIFLLPACQSQGQNQQTAEDDETGIYTSKTPSRDGIGKVYMGREISHVMGHLGASWLERDERKEEERTDLAIQNLPLSQGDVVADIGAGTGYYTFRIAPRVPEGKVLAVDIQPEMLDMIEEKQAVLGIQNVERILGTEKDPNLPENGVDLVLMVDVYHEFAFPREMMEAIYRSLKKGGKVVLLEYRAEDPKVPIKQLHKMSEKQVRREMEAVGLRFIENKTMLPWQHFLVFER